MVDEWEDQYKQGKQDCIFPFTDLVSLVYRHVTPFPGMKVLELGCGTGTNIPLFRQLGSDYYGIEGSASAVETLIKRHPEYKTKIITGDFTKVLPENIKFDLIVDRSALTHNTTEDIINTLNNLYNIMASPAHYIGVDWFSISHSDYNEAATVVDDHTLSGLGGQFKDIGRVHFSTETHLKYLFKMFTIKALNYKLTVSQLDNRVATYDIVASRAEKP